MVRKTKPLLRVGHDTFNLMSWHRLAFVAAVRPVGLFIAAEKIMKNISLFFRY
jgi:hypothetical protein